jgi:hypothetical protein
MAWVCSRAVDQEIEETPINVLDLLASCDTRPGCVFGGPSQLTMQLHLLRFLTDFSHDQS